jgi:hypothetical protein
MTWPGIKPGLPQWEAVTNCYSSWFWGALSKGKVEWQARLFLRIRMCYIPLLQSFCQRTSVTVFKSVWWNAVYITCFLYPNQNNENYNISVLWKYSRECN